MKDQPSNKAPNANQQLQSQQQQSKQQNTQQQKQKQQQSKKNQPNQQKQKQQPKKKKNASTTSIPNMLHYHRINFLYQASHLLMNTHMQMKEQEQLYASLTGPATTTTIETNKSTTCLNESNHGGGGGGGDDDDDVPMTSVVVEEKTTETETETEHSVQHQHQHTILNAKQVSQHYSRTLSKISAKNVLRLHSDMKRTLCKKCHLLSIAGETCSVRISNKRNRCYMIVTCGQCGTFRRYMLNDGNQKKKQTTTTKKQATNIINNEQQQGSTSTSDAQNVLSSNSTGESMITTE